VIVNAQDLREHEVRHVRISGERVGRRRVVEEPMRRQVSIQQHLAAQRYIPPVEIAAVYSALGDSDPPSSG
jgi:hypothetical protein